jgi:5'-methylthioadenosine phosphorylase
LRAIALKSSVDVGVPTHDSGTMVVIQGPRFSTRAESAFYAGQGWEVIGMTQSPEAVLARELEMCYGNISLVTDYDVGVIGQMEPVTHEEVIRVFNENLSRLRELLFRLIAEIPQERTCPCATALANARFEV